MEVINVPNGLLLPQHKYIQELLEKFGMVDLKTMATPTVTNQQLKLNDGTGSSETTTYRQVIGTLQYLSLTRPDVSYAIAKLAPYIL